MGTDHEHRVCTYQEAEKAIKGAERIYLMDCFCRAPARDGKAKWAYCGHTVETCLGFHEPTPEVTEGEPFEFREIDRKKALELHEGWKKKGLFFRFMEDEQWICCCCGCGCGWFRDKEGNLRQDPCGKSPFLESTDREMCNLCGDCVDVCAYNARAVENDEMLVEAEQCYGCSACEFACPESAIVMVPR